MSGMGHDHMQPIGDAFFEQALRYICIASSVILIYDTLLTLDLEVAHVWRSRWTLTKILYFATRYSAFLDLPLILTFYLSPNVSLEQCSRLHMGLQWLFGLGIGSAQGVLVLRTIALYNHDKNLRSYIYLFLFLVYTPVTLIVVFYANSAQFGPPPPGVVGCHIVEKNYILFTAYIALAITETVLVTLTVRQALKKFGDLTIPAKEERGGYSLIRTLYRDGILFFICLFLLSIANMMVAFHGPYSDLLSTLQRVLHGTLTSRMVLHLRDAAAHPSVLDFAVSADGEGRMIANSINNTRHTRVSSIRFERFGSPINGEGALELQDVGGQLRPQTSVARFHEPRPLVVE